MVGDDVEMPGRTIATLEGRCPKSKGRTFRFMCENMLDVAVQEGGSSKNVSDVEGRGRS